MIQEKFYVLAFDNKDTKKIVEYFKNKKNLNKFLAITPNAFEILKKNKFKYIFTPFDIYKDLHKDLALDNIEFRDKIIQNSNKNINNIFLNESFKNILIQSFSTLNFFNKILKLENYYYTYLNNKFELIPNKELYNNIVKKIILENYGIFKVNKKNSNQNFYLKKLINNFLFFFLKKKKIIFNFLNNNKKLSNSPNTIEITFGSLSNSTLVNYYLFGYNFLQFFFKKKIKKIFPDINYKIDLNLRDKIEEFINKLKIDLFTDIDKEFFNFICENIQYENELEKFLYKRFDKLHVKYLFADHLTWKDPYCVSKFLYKKKIEVFLCSHGMIDISDNIHEKNELYSLANGLFYSKYASTVIAQTPTGYTISKSFLKYKNFKIIKAHPFAYYGQRKIKKNDTNKINILFAGTYKVFLSRPYIYQGSFEFFETIKNLVIIFKNLKNINLTINIRTNDEIDNSLLRELSKESKNIKIVFNEDIENLMQKSHILMTNFSTLIDEYSYLEKPIIILNDYLNYESYKHMYSQSNKDKINSIYYYKCEDLKNQLNEIIEKIRKQNKLETPKHIWKINEAIDKKNLLNKIQNIEKNNL